MAHETQTRKIEIPENTLAVLFEYAMMTDAEVSDRGIKDLTEILPEVRRLLDIPENCWPNPEADTDGLRAELNTAVEALAGDSSDAEHYALYNMAEWASSQLGEDLDDLIQAREEEYDAAGDEK